MRLKEWEIKPAAWDKTEKQKGFRWSKLVAQTELRVREAQVFTDRQVASGHSLSGPVILPEQRYFSLWYIYRVITCDFVYSKEKHDSKAISILCKNSFSLLQSVSEHLRLYSMTD